MFGKDKAVIARLSRLTVYLWGIRGDFCWCRLLRRGVFPTMTGIGLPSASMSTSATGSGIGGGGWGPGDIEKGRKESRFEQSPNDVDEFPDISESKRPGITGELW